MVLFKALTSRGICCKLTRLILRSVKFSHYCQDYILLMGSTKCTANEFIQSHFQDCFLGVLYIKKIVPSTFFVCLKNFRTNCTDSHLWGLLYVTVLKIYISNYGFLFGTATYVDYLTFSHLNPITNPNPLPNATLTIGATARNPNYRGSHVYPNYWGSRTQP
jgi:hypothetical protein